MICIFFFLLVLQNTVALDCGADCNKVKCFNDFDPAACPKNSAYSPTGGQPCGCCPVCIKRVAERGKCSESGEDLFGDFDGQTEVPAAAQTKLGSSKHLNLGSKPTEIQGTKCLAGLQCVAGVCENGTLPTQIRPQNCFDWLTNNRIPYFCNPDGTYAPVQCHGKSDDTRCYCVDKRNKRIYGTAPYAEKESMNCACSRRIAELQEAGRTDMTLHCDSMGNYEELQCDDGLCWCVNPGTTKAYSHAVKENFVRMLPCYNADKFGKQYLRRCESLNYAKAKLEDFLIKRGVVASLPKESCDWDGGYGPVQCDGSSCKCTKKDKTQIGAFAGTAAQKDTMTCLCARDTIILNGQGFLCDEGGLGNYKSDQSNFCIDENAVVLPAKFLPDCKPPKCPSHPVPYSVWKSGSCA